MRIVLVLLALGTGDLGPQKGDRLCWATSISKPECGTYGWHKSESAALKAAMDLCIKTCGHDCEKDYCETVE